MADEPGFAELLARLRSGDPEAADRLVRHYESAIRIAIRARMLDPRLHRIVDSMDIFQSVMARFFSHTLVATEEINDSKQLLGLLVCMAERHVAERYRFETQQRRDFRRVLVGGMTETIDAAPAPHEALSAKDFVDQIRVRLQDDERLLLEQRLQGRTWPEIAEKLGGTAESRRKQLSRALQRVAPDSW